MKGIISVFALALALTVSARAGETSTKISSVHLCCQSCVKGVQKALAGVDGVSASIDKDAETVTLTGPDKASVQKAADALASGGYFGTSSNPEIKLAANSGARGTKVQSLKLEGVHLCCGKCVSAVDEALKSVPGVKSHTAVKNAKSFEVSGDFNDQDVVSALNKAGLNGKVAQ